MRGFDAGIVFFVTHDLMTTARFYEDVLGLPLVLDQGKCRIYEVADRSYIGFCEREREFSTEGIILTLVTDDVDGRYEDLLKRGVEIEQKPGLNPDYKIYHFFLRDPNGYLLEIQRFEDPRWPA